MGLVQDAITLAKAGYGTTSGTLNLLSKLSGESENLVWTEISSAVGDVASVWWEQSEEVRNACVE
jgi:aminopeptidase 2